MSSSNGRRANRSTAAWLQATATLHRPCLSAVRFPHYDSHANIPLLVWHPDHRGNGRAATGLTSTVDLFATVLEAAGATTPARTHSRSLLPLLAGDPAAGRPGLLYGTFGQGICCTDGEWSVLKSPERDGPLHASSSMIVTSPVVDGAGPPTDAGRFIPGVDLPQWRIPVDQRRSAGNPAGREDLLFHRAADPEQTRNLWHDEPRQRRRVLDLLRELMVAEGTPPEQFERLGLDA